MEKFRWSPSQVEEWLDAPQTVRAFYYAAAELRAEAEDRAEKESRRPKTPRRGRR